MEIDEEFKEIPVGKWEVIEEGEDIAVLAVGWTVWQAKKAIDRLKEEKKVYPMLVNARFIKPLDMEVLSEIKKKFKVVLTVEENAVAGGFGSGVNEVLVSSFAGKIYNLGIPDRFIEHGPQSILREKVGIDWRGIYKKLLEIIGT